MKLFLPGFAALFLSGLPMTVVNAASNETKLTVKIHQTDKFKKQDLDLLMKARNYIEIAINSEEFKSKVLNFTYQGQKTFVQNNGMTNEQIYNHLMTGAEQLPEPSPPDHVLDLSLALYAPGFSNRTVIGYTSPDDPVIHINRKIYRESDPNDIADNLVHEWCHKMGFDHDFEVTPRRDFSVPYAVGYIIDDLVQKLEE